MSLINVINDLLKEVIEQDIKIQKQNNAKWAQEQIQNIVADPHLTDVTKAHFICEISHQLDNMQNTQNVREFWLNMSRGLNEASKLAEQHAKKQED